jgi:uncharacterized membrane protein YqjE
MERPLFTGSKGGIGNALLHGAHPLVAIALWVGLADGLIGFFIAHMRGCETGRDAWLRDLLHALLLGGLLTGGGALAAGLGLIALFCLVAWVVSKRLPLPLAPRPSILYAKTAVVLPGIFSAYYTSNVIDELFIVIGIASGAILVAVAVLPVDRYLARIAKIAQYLPLAVTLVVIGTFWYGEASHLIRRFSWMDRYGALLKAGMPLLLLALPWTLLWGRRRLMVTGSRPRAGSRRPGMRRASSCWWWTPSARTALLGSPP